MSGRDKIFALIGVAAGWMLSACPATPAQEKDKAPAKKIAIRAGRLIDGKSDTPILNALIVVEGDKIVSVTAGGTAPAGVELIDLSKATVLPGFADVHTHVLLNGDITAEDYDTQLLKESIPYRAILAARNARIALDHGFTTIRDVETEGAMYADVDVKMAIARGEVPGSAHASRHARHDSHGHVSTARLFVGVEGANRGAVRRWSRRRAQSRARAGDVRCGLDQILLRPPLSL